MEIFEFNCTNSACEMERKFLRFRYNFTRSSHVQDLKIRRRAEQLKNSRI